MSEVVGRARFFEANPQATAWAALEEATDQQRAMTAAAARLEPGRFAGKRALVLGAGVGGLATAYELLTQEREMHVTVLEAQHRTGGRCLSLRTGDTLTEDASSDLDCSTPGETQVVRFEHPVGDSEPYLNAGPGRIPSSHKRLLDYLRRFGVAVEIYVMNTSANLVQMEAGPVGDEPVVYGRVDHNVRGFLAQMVYQHADELIRSWPGEPYTEAEVSDRAQKLRDLMISFGELVASGPNKGKYAPDAGEAGFENARSRAGFEVLPGVDVGKIAPPLDPNSLLDSKFWEKVRFYQPSDFLWQPTLFQPVGGMDQVQHAFAQQVASLGGTVHLNSPVTSIDWDSESNEFVVQVARIGTDETIEHRADYVFSNLAMPFLKDILSDSLQSPAAETGFSPEFKAALHAVYHAQFKPPADVYQRRFLADTTKVGWQADRSLWQGSRLEPEVDELTGLTVTRVPKSEVGVVPIFGGISWTDHDIVQIWYPSYGYHDEKGVLTGAYNFADTAWQWGKMCVADRLRAAREGAERFGQDFAGGLDRGVAIAWQNMPHIKGGWAVWQTVENGVDHFNELIRGTGVGEYEESSDPNFFIVGDQVSSLPGWQEGAVDSAHIALSRMAAPGYELPRLQSLPDTRIMVEGI